MSVSLFARLRFCPHGKFKVYCRARRQLAVLTDEFSIHTQSHCDHVQGWWLWPGLMAALLGTQDPA